MTNNDKSNEDISGEEERWIEMEADNIDDDDDPVIQDLFADPDPYDTFPFTFRPANTKISHNNNNNNNKADEESIDITLKGIKAENGQLLNSTGLTLWRASSLLCDFLCANPHLVREKRVLELGAGLGLCGILSYRLGASRTVMTDGDTDALENMRENVNFNIGGGGSVDGGVNGIEKGNDNGYDNGENAPSKSLLTCAQLRWGRHIEAFKKRWSVDTTNNEGVTCDRDDDDNDNDDDADGGGCFDVIMGSDIIYAEDILEPLFDTVVELLSKSSESMFLLAYARRNVKIDLVFECGERHGLTWIEPEGVEGVFIFSRRNIT